MRTRKDPGTRQEAFIKAGTELFIEKGYEAVSVRDILDRVADKTASPSVFYYYFSSKDVLYHACVERMAQSYLSAMQSVSDAEIKTIAAWAVSLVACMENYLLNENNLIMTGASTANRLFILDMKERVTGSIAAMWAVSLVDVFGMQESEAAGTAQFLAGGISELIMSYLMGEDHGKRSVYDLTDHIVRMAFRAIGLSQEQREELDSALEAYRKKST